jgi:hypothetical protein
VVAFGTYAFGYKVTISKNVIRISVDVISNFKAKVQKAQTIPNSSKNYNLPITQIGLGIFA